MPENRQVLRNADSGDNIEGGADFSGDWFSFFFFVFLVMIHGLNCSDHRSMMMALCCFAREF